MATTTIIADDLTGALDAGACLLPRNVEVAVLPDAAQGVDAQRRPTVLSVNADTRHVAPTEAYERVFTLAASAREAGSRCVIKKTDSALRGNVGAELAAAYRAAGERRLHFLPAFPSMGRATRGGVQLVDGLPVAQSPFGSDPFEPVTSSRVDEIIRRQSDVAVRVVPVGEPVPQDFSGIVVYDALTDADMRSRVEELARLGELGALAGCAGLASALAAVLGHDEGAASAGCDRDRGNLLVVCGSVNPVSQGQCSHAREAGACVYSIAEVQKCSRSWQDAPEGVRFFERVEESWGSSPLTVVDGSGREDLSALVPKGKDVRQLVADNVASILLCVCERGTHGRVLVTGGDILASFLAQAGIKRVRPLGELADGIVAMDIELGGQDLMLASKSGGFGNRELFVDLAKQSRL